MQLLVLSLAVLMLSAPLSHCFPGPSSLPSWSFLSASLPLSSYHWLPAVSHLTQYCNVSSSWLQSLYILCHCVLTANILFPLLEGPSLLLQLHVQHHSCLSSNFTAPTHPTHTHTHMRTHVLEKEASRMHSIQECTMQH